MDLRKQGITGNVAVENPGDQKYRSDNRRRGKQQTNGNVRQYTIHTSRYNAAHKDETESGTAYVKEE